MRPYPESMAARRLEESANRRSTARPALHEIIPPELRLTVLAPHRACKSCGRFTRNAGGCPGVNGTGPYAPSCHEEAKP